MHAAYAVFIVDFNGVRIVNGYAGNILAFFQILDLLELQRLGWATCDYIIHQFIHAVLGKPLFRHFFIGADVVAPSADNSHISTLNGVHTVIGATGKLELEFVR